MENGLYWIAVGGLSFWLPAAIAAAALHQNANLWMLNVAPLAGVTLMGVASWIRIRHLPKWGWVLAGIYVLARACLNAGPVGISSRPIFTERSGRGHLDVPHLLVSSNDSLDGIAERDDFFGADRHGDTAISRGIPKKIGVYGLVLRSRNETLAGRLTAT